MEQIIPCGCWGIHITEQCTPCWMTQANRLTIFTPNLKMFFPLVHSALLPETCDSSTKTARSLKFVTMMKSPAYPNNPATQLSLRLWPMLKLVISRPTGTPANCNPILCILVNLQILTGYNMLNLAPWTDLPKLVALFSSKCHQYEPKSIKLLTYWS